MEDPQTLVHEEERSPARGIVYTDGKGARISYLWQDPVPVPEGFVRAGVLYVVPADTDWISKTLVLDEKWRDVMAQALPLFEAEVKQLISQLNAAGLSLADLPEFIELANDPEKLKAL